jgi:aspartyl-tRNA(Asn)/glutamyl-tRNA(Gln) amidotransferase subunit A
MRIYAPDAGRGPAYSTCGKFKPMAQVNRRLFLASSLGAAFAAAQTSEPASLTLAEAAAGLRARKFSPADLVEACLARIETYNPKVNAFITVMREQARADAKQLANVAPRGPLHGIPIALKDNIDTAGTRTTAASAVFDSRIPTADAQVTRRLKAAGAIVIGKTNLHEFANGGTSVVSYFGPVRNPWALDRHPGGSSGGSGAAVAADLCYGALGTDTGGSIRTPASLCGIVGLKPTHGLVSIDGIVPLVWTLDHCGPMTKTVEDAALLLQVLAGYDPNDLHSIERPIPNYVAEMKKPVSDVRLGILRVPFFDKLEADVAKPIEDALKVLAKLTSSHQEAVLPDLRGTQLPGEMYAYHESYFKTSAGRYQIPVRRNLQRGAEGKAFEYVQGWRKIMTLRRTIGDWFAQNEVDLLVLPTMRREPRTVESSLKMSEEEKPRNPELANTSEFNILGIPAITVPCGFNARGIPVGLMIAGRPWDEGRVLALAHAFERATEWHKSKPPLKPDTPVPELKTSEA